MATTSKLDPVKEDRIMVRVNVHAENLSGKKYGRWTVLIHSNKKRQSWLCRCDCGTEREVFSGDFKSGKSRSCGCIISEVTAKRNLTHGRTFSIEYECWCGIKKRCYNEKSAGFHLYGARGIKVCERWLNSFENFFADMGLKPSPDHSIERKDMNGDYSPENCCWATDLEQGKNKRNNRWLTARGETFHLSEWARKLDVSVTFILNRIKRGWTVEDAVFLPKQPPRFRKKRVY